jgi:hypothetical protein
MTSNSIASGALQTMAVTPPERVSEHSPAKTVKAQIPEQKEELSRVNEPAKQLPVAVYNSHGEIVPSPSSPSAGYTA